MSRHSKLITLVAVVLAVSYLSLNRNAISSDLPKPPPQEYGKYGTTDTPKYFVPPPPFSEDIFPHVEISESFNHASKQRWCLDCHNPDNRDVLRLANGELISFEESYFLCGQCHGTIFRDWKAGIHGKRTGEWNGKKQYRLCVHCHNPHSPKFKPLKPMPPPDNPLEIKYRKLKDEEIPRNPLGNIQ
jgi:hypothetical protein